MEGVVKFVEEGLGIERELTLVCEGLLVGLIGRVCLLNLERMLVIVSTLGCNGWLY